jgi:hypothetical protein
LERFAIICHHNGKVDFNVHCIRAKNMPIRGTEGVSDGLVPMLKAYNTSIATVFKNSKNKGPINIKDLCLYECPGLIEAWDDEFEVLYAR